jgi:hypothetical protein
VIAAGRYHDGPWSATVAASPIVERVLFEAGRTVHIGVDKVGATARGELIRTWSRASGLRDVEVRGGAEADVGRWSLDLAAGNPPDEGTPDMDMGPPSGDDITQRFDGAIWTTDLAAWTSVAGNLGPKIRFTSGLRLDAFTRSRDLSVQPRGELAYAATERTKVRLVAGAYRRPAEYRDELLDAGLHPERSTQVILGVEHAPASGVKVQTSAYYTDRSALLTRGDGGGYENQGRGTTYGAELFTALRRGPWFAFVSYSLSRSTRVDRPGAPERLFDFDQTHDLNLAATWKRGRWQLGGRFEYTSGTPETDVIGAIYDSDRDRYLPIFGPINAVRKPAHHQLDVRIEHTWGRTDHALTAFIDVANVYLNAPILGTQYSFDYSERTTVTGLPIIPSIGLRGEL